jgi:hypothetical protein
MKYFLELPKDRNGRYIEIGDTLICLDNLDYGEFEVYGIYFYGDNVCIIDDFAGTEFRCEDCEVVHGQPIQS